MLRKKLDLDLCETSFYSYLQSAAACLSLRIFDIPVSLMAVIGSLVLLGWRWVYLKVSPADMLKKTPWYIIVFAFGMYTIIYGLNNIGLTDWLITFMRPMVSGSLLHTSVMMGSS